MRVGILGSGLMGGKLGTLFARAGHEVVFSYARSTEKLQRLAKDAKGNARAGTPHDAAQDADALLLAVHWSRIDDVLNQTGDLSGKVIVTCSLPMNADDTASSSPIPRRARRRWQRRLPKPGSCVRSTPYRAKCSSEYTPAASRAGRASCTAAMIRAAKGLPPS